MHPNIEGVILVAGGVFTLFAALGFVHVSKNPAAEEAWREKYGLWLKILGPIVVLYGLAEFMGLVG